MRPAPTRTHLTPPHTAPHTSPGCDPTPSSLPAHACQAAPPRLPASQPTPTRCVLTCAFEPPKPKTKHKLELDSVQAYQDMQAAEKQYFLDMIKKVPAAVSSGAVD